MRTYGGGVHESVGAQFAQDTHAELLRQNLKRVPPRSPFLFHLLWALVLSPPPFEFLFVLLYSVSPERSLSF